MLKLLDRYDVQATISDGAGRRVYAATGDGQSVLIHVVEGGHVVESAKQLSHPNIAGIQAIETSGGETYVVADHVNGVTLYDRLSKHGRFSSGQSMQVLEQILSALGHAHQHGVVHGNLNSKDVWLSKGEDGSAKVTVSGFGIQIGAQAAANGAERGDGNQVIGIVNCCAPEVVMGVAPRPESDVYAAGMLLLEMLMAQSAFRASSPEEEFARHIRAPLRIPQRVASSALGEFVVRAGNKRPDDRFTDALVMQRVLSSLEVDEFQVRPDQIPMETVQSYMGPTGIFAQGETLQLVPAIPYVAQSETVQVMLSDDEHLKLQAMRAAAMGGDTDSDAGEKPQHDRYRVQARKFNPSTGTAEPERKLPENQETVMVVMSDEKLRQIQEAARPDYLTETQELNAFAEDFKLADDDVPQESRGRRVERDLLWAAVVVLLIVCSYFFFFNERPAKSDSPRETPKETKYETF